MNDSVKREVVASPCVSICALDGDDVCIGCFRTGGEVSRWGLLSADEQRDVLDRCRRRMAGESVACGADFKPAG
ncbi:MAG: DUF1289 domain-containing protein [Alcanivoracaceae bacterium]|jgi:hypothetical protein|nr:DUF1289 domain-containing protein [Alcanivoracaceae bacterium]